MSPVDLRVIATTRTHSVTMTPRDHYHNVSPCSRRVRQRSRESDCRARDVLTMLHKGYSPLNLVLCLLRVTLPTGKAHPITTTTTPSLICTSQIPRRDTSSSHIIVNSLGHRLYFIVLFIYCTYAHQYPCHYPCSVDFSLLLAIIIFKVLCGRRTASADYYGLFKSENHMPE